LVQTYRLSRVAVHLLYAVVIVGTLFPWLTVNLRARLERHWNNGLMGILNIKLLVRGALPELSAQNVMLVANHVSWLDIYVLNAVRPVSFVSKMEVLSWPVVGWLAKKTGTLFIDRSKRHDIARVNNEVSRVLLKGGCVAVFPEGTTSDGSTLRHFHASLLQPAVNSQSTVWPAAIRYCHADGTLNTAPAYIDELTFADSIKLVLSQAVIFVELEFLSPINAHGKTRRDLARVAQYAIANALNLNLQQEADAVMALAV
jgi:1-acyl-sn-glycerol-3-phosphate acyltransferase